eukprot:TRINITY_DN961_c0_g1_i1.p1 TRINITY_DN961_c0_g1~~TRINITY_DN961_c0_g1_i1.p1  ORF type:complete len:518 (-),score=162.15 TRINITY_DN961_c0_g1_i1:70-1560(-)
MKPVGDSSTVPLLNGQRAPSKRGCNDILFAILFLLMVAGMAVVASVAFAKGDPKLLLSSQSQEYIQKYGENFVQSHIQDAVAQVKADIPALTISLAVAVVVGILWIQMMRTFTKLFVYLTLIFGILMIIAAGAYSLSIGIKDTNTGLHVVGYCLFGLAAFLLLLIVFLYKKIALTCAMMTETCKGVQNSPALFITVILTLGLLLGFVAVWTTSFVYLYSIPGDNVTFNPSAGSIQPPQFNEKIRNVMYFMVFGFLWTAAFLSATFQHSVAGAISSWYFSRGTAGMGKIGSGIGSPALASFARSFTTSLGSLAFGSLLIAIIEFFAFLLRLTKKANYTNRFAVFIINCFQCLLGCIGALVKWVNKFAYIHVAMHGTSFCTSARNCFDLVSRNMFDTVIIDLISGFVLNVGKILFTAVVVMVAIGINHAISPVSVSLIAVTSFVILHIISHIIGVGVDTVFICYLEDLEMNKDGNLYMSPEVHAMLQERVKARNPEKV